MTQKLDDNLGPPLTVSSPYRSICCQLHHVEYHLVRRLSNVEFSFTRVKIIYVQMIFRTCPNYTMCCCFESPTFAGKALPLESGRPGPTAELSPDGNSRTLLESDAVALAGVVLKGMEGELYPVEKHRCGQPIKTHHL